MAIFFLFITSTAIAAIAAIAAIVCIAVCRRSSQRNQEVVYL